MSQGKLAGALYEGGETGAHDDKNDLYVFIVTRPRIPGFLRNFPYGNKLSLSFPLCMCFFPSACFYLINLTC